MTDADATRSETHDAAPPGGARAGGLALGREAAGLVHDLNNILGVILGAAAEGENADLTSIVRAAERGRAMLRGVLTPGSQATARDAERLVLDDVIADLRAPLAHLGGGHVDVRFEPGAPGLHVPLSRDALERMLLNLVANARDASPRGGVVALRTRVAGAHAIVEVHDDGPGIPPDVLARMGERFFTTKAPGHGTGLGLATIRDLLREIGGHLSIDGGAGLGASVALHIPVCGDLSQPERASAAAGATVLLVEDEDMLRGLFARALTQAGWRVLQADSAEAALDALEPPPVDLAALVTDLALPGMTGRQLVERVRAMPGWADLPVVFASGWPDAELQHGRPADSITAMLAKPFDPRDLTTLLAAMTTPAHGIQPVARQKMG